MFRTFRTLDGSCETVRENLAASRYVIAIEWLKNYVVPTLGVRCPIPRSVKRDENTVPVPRGKFAFVVTGHRVWCPMSRKSCDRRELAGANADSFAAIASIFRCEHQLVLERIVIALGPTIIAAGLQQHHLFRRQRRFFILLEEVWPIGVQLISPVLSYKDASDGVDRKAFPIAYSGCVSFRRREQLVHFVCIEAPYSTARLQFPTWLVPRNLRLPILCLAGVCCAGHIHIEIPIVTNDEGMHRVIAAQRQLRNNRLRSTG